jgi:hypothetical protein
MRTIKYILSVVVLSSIMLVSLSTYASVIVTGTIETKKVSEKFTLKNLSFAAHKTATFASLKSSLEYKGIGGSFSRSNSNNTNYIMYSKGNTSYVIPYHYNVILSKFKTPSAQ